MSFKKKVLKIFEGLSLEELCEAQSCIDELITKLEKGGAASQKKTDIERREQERFYEIFPCKLTRADKQGESHFHGTVVDISKNGLRLKTSEKFTEGNVLILSPDYDRIYKKIYVEVVRVKEFVGQFEIGVKHIFMKETPEDQDIQ